MPQQQQSAAGFLVFLMILWIIFPDAENRTQSILISDLAHERLRRFWAALDVLNETQWGDFAPTPTEADNAGTASWLNLTGFRQEDHLAWEGLDQFRDKSLQLSQYVAPSIDGQHPLGLPIWANASGTLHGEWVRKLGPEPRTYESYNLSDSVPSMHWVGDHIDWARNVTGDSGKMVLRLEGNRTTTEYEQLTSNEANVGGGLIRNVQATVDVEDSAGSHLNWAVRLWGAHWPRQGVILLTTTSEKFEGVFGLPHLTPGADYFKSSQMLLNQTLADTLRAKEKNVFFDQDVPWNSDIENPGYTTHPSPQCEFVMYAQVHPPSWQDLGLDRPNPEGGAMANLVEAVEDELQSPQGAPIPKIPELKMSAVIYSPDCGFFLESKGPPNYAPSEAHHLVGLKKEVHLHRIKRWILAFAFVVGLQVWVLKTQLAESCTPSTTARVSFGTVSFMVIADGMTFMAAATWLSSAASTFLPTLVLMFSSFLSTVIGGSFLSKIHEIQIPEGRERRDRSQLDSGSTSEAASTVGSGTGPAQQGQGGAETLLPTAAATEARSRTTPPGPIIVPADQDIDAEIAEAASAVPQAGAALQRETQQTPAQSFQAILGRFILLGICISFLLVSSTTWYPDLRSTFHNLCAFAYLSLWVPQIYRNVMRNCRRALRWQFVCGQSALRAMPLAYFWLKRDNFLYAHPDPGSFLMLCAWLWLQMVVLVAQEVVGPRFCVPGGWTPDAWDYHPVLREDNLEAGGLPIGLVAEDQPGAWPEDEGGERRKRPDGLQSRAIDCAICRELLEAPVVKAGEEASGVAVALGRRLYMVTPCRHIFHTACLEGWMRFRLQCPICREELPPL